MSRSTERPGAVPHADAAPGAERWVGGRLRADPRLPAYLAGGFGAVAVAAATGQHALAALAAPFLTLAGARLGDMPPAVSGSVTLAGTRVVEGDEVEGAVHLDWDGEAEVDVMLTGWRGLSAVEPSPAAAWAVDAGTGPVTLPFRVRADAWGIHSLGDLWVRVRRPRSLMAREHKLAAAPILRVLPHPVRIDALLRPAEPRSVAGAHLSRLRSHGTDFAELRPYQPGDRLRDVSWSASARLGSPWVTVHHAERTGTVLLLLDTDGGFGADMEETARAARTAWAVAEIHLRAQDRVGLLATGRTPAWLPPRGGRRARWMLLEEILSIGVTTSRSDRPHRTEPRVHVPPDALIVAVTSLDSADFVRDLLRYRRGGHAVAALVLERGARVDAPRDATDAAARRLWQVRRATAARVLERGGVAAAVVTGDAGVAPAVASLRRRLAPVRVQRFRA